MGVSTDAIFGYGIALGAAIEIEWAATEVVERSDCGVEIIRHCSDEFTMIGFAVNVVTANRGDPQRIKIDRSLPKNANARLLKAIKIYADHIADPEEKQALLSIKAKDFGWFICSYWG